MVVTGFVIVTAFAAQLSLLDLNAQSGDFFWPIILRALGLSLVTIPLTQLAVSGLPQRDIPQGVALNNMMRQMGGSFGIAFINTFLDHRMAAHRVTLVSRLAAGEPATDGRQSQLTRMLVAKGETTWDASHKALGLLEATIQRQASLLSYLDAYRLVAFLSLVCVPLILFAGRSKPLTKDAPRPPMPIDRATPRKRMRTKALFLLAFAASATCALPEEAPLGPLNLTQTIQAVLERYPTIAAAQSAVDAARARSMQSNAARLPQVSAQAGYTYNSLRPYVAIAILASRPAQSMRTSRIPTAPPSPRGSS